MAVVVVNEIEGANQDFYDQVNPKVMPDDKLPDGCQAHIAGPIDNGWRVITVWNSDDDFQKFRDEKLIPVLKESGGEERVEAAISADPVHNFIT
jgi:hypothetical protein